MAGKITRVKVEIPYGIFSRRTILTEAMLHRRAALARQLNSRPLTPERVRKLESEGRLYSADLVLRQRVVDLDDIPYERLLEKENLFVQPACPRTAADHFLEYQNTRRIDSDMVEKHPLLATLLDVMETQEYDKSRIDLTVVGIMARADAPEIALCAGIYRQGILPLLDKVYKCEGDLSLKFAYQEILRIGARLGVERKTLIQGITKINKINDAIDKVLDRLIVSRHWLLHKMDLTPEHIVNLVNLTRSLLRDRETRIFYAAMAINALKGFAEQRYKKVIEAGEEKPLDGIEEAYRRHYFLQVLPIVEELNIFRLSEEAKEVYFKAFRPLAYEKMVRWLWEGWRFDPPSSQAHVRNIVRLIKETGKMTNLLPEEAQVSGRVKSFFSIFEKMLHEYGEVLPKYYMRIHDLFGIKILVPHLSDVERAVALMRQTFEKVKEAIDRVNRGLPYAYPNALPYPFFKGLSSEAYERFRGLSFYEEETRAELERRGYINGERDSISATSRRGHGRVPYYYMIFSTYHLVPIEVEITTQEYEKQINRKKPHWKYKLIKQLRLEGLGKGIQEKDFSQRAKGAYVLLRDDNQRSYEAVFIPAENATAASFPHHRRAYSFDAEIKQREQAEPPPESIRLQNGDILIRLIGD